MEFSHVSKYLRVFGDEIMKRINEKKNNMLSSPLHTHFAFFASINYYPITTKKCVRAGKDPKIFDFEEMLFFEPI